MPLTVTSSLFIQTIVADDVLMQTVDWQPGMLGKKHHSALATHHMQTATHDLHQIASRIETQLIGKKQSDPIQINATQIKALVDSTFDGALNIAHEARQQDLDDNVAALHSCNKGLFDFGGTLEDLLSTEGSHLDCRKSLRVETANQIHHCELLETWRADISLPSFSLPESPKSAWQNIVELRQDLKALEDAGRPLVLECDRRIELVNNKTSVCTEKQQNFETAACVFATEKHTACPIFNQCWSNAYAALEASIQMSSDERALMAECSNVKERIHCLLNVSEASLDSADAVGTEVAKCAEVQGTVPRDFQWDLPVRHDSQNHTCDMSTFDIPGDEAFRTKHYGGFDAAEAAPADQHTLNCPVAHRSTTTTTTTTTTAAPTPIALAPIEVGRCPAPDGLWSAATWVYTETRQSCTEACDALGKTCSTDLLQRVCDAKSVYAIDDNLGGLCRKRRVQSRSYNGNPYYDRGICYTWPANKVGIGTPSSCRITAAQHVNGAILPLCACI